jgi:hypothetical protein
MVANSLLQPILHNEHLTRRLGDPEARILIEWLVDQAESLAVGAICADDAKLAVADLCRRGRSIGRFVSLWCHEGNYAAACQLAASERFAWPLPSGPIDPFDLMQGILAWESGCR